MIPTNPYRASTQKQAVAMCRYWWNRYHDLPWWRPKARGKALRIASFWGRVAKQLREEMSD